MIKGGHNNAIPGLTKSPTYDYATQLSPHPIKAPTTYDKIIKTAKIIFYGSLSNPSLIKTPTVTAGLKCPPEIAPK